MSDSPSPSPSRNPTEAYDPLPTNRISYYLDYSISGFGKLVSWLWLVTLAVVLSNVFSRFILGRGSIALEELSWHLFGATMMLTLAYAVVQDDHVRVDVLRDRFSTQTKAWIDFIAIVLLLLPILYLMIDQMIDYAYRAYERGERSQAPSGLPYRFIIKSMLPIGMSLVGLAIISHALRCCTLLFGFPKPYVKPPALTDNNIHSHH